MTPSAATLTPDPAALLERLRRLVVKDGVGLGLLTADELALALAFVWAGLPEDVAMTEREINTALKAQLAGPASCLRTDHVELRRWLVDAGWLQRDGYGREYRRLRAGAALWRNLADTLRTALAGTPTAEWAAAQRSAHADARASRRQRWQQQAQPGGGA